MAVPILSFKDPSGGAAITNPYNHGSAQAAGTITPAKNVYISHNSASAITTVAFYTELASPYTGSSTAAADLAELQAGSWLQINQNIATPAWVSFTTTVGITTNRIALTSGQGAGNQINAGVDARVQLRMNIPLTVSVIGTRQIGFTVGFTYS